MDAFGPGRVMYGSNWSLSGLRGPYAGMVDLLKEYCEQHPDLSPGQLFYENAMKAYGLADNTNSHPGSGNGLFVSYWNGKAGGRGWFTDSISGEYIPAVDAYWTEGPAEGVNPDFWNARYTGEIEAEVSGSHRLFLTIDTYAKLWIGGELVIDAWESGSGVRCHVAEVDLTAGHKTQIRIDYGHASGAGYIRLEWEADDLSREVIPESQLFNSVDTTSQTGFRPDLASDAKVQVFPNPVVGELCIHCPDEAFCTVYAQNGKRMDAFRISDSITRRETSQWSPGVYFVHIDNGERKFVRKVIVS